MSNPIEQYYKYAQLAQASYGLFDGVDYSRGAVIASLIADKKGDFTAQQALDFTNLTNGYALVQTQPTTSEGFSASVFKSNADGEYILSIRGTEIAPHTKMYLVQISVI
jgi:hypothetical protein